MEEAALCISDNILVAYIRVYIICRVYTIVDDKKISSITSTRTECRL